jgi:hypothetical protein
MLYVPAFAFAIFSFLLGVNADVPQPLNISRWFGKRVLMISAHPDDIEASAGSFHLIE